VFTMAIKVAVTPVYMKRRQVNLRTLGAMCGGASGRAGGNAAALLSRCAPLPARGAAAGGGDGGGDGVYNLYRRRGRAARRRVPAASMGGGSGRAHRSGSGIFVGRSGRAGVAGAAESHQPDAGAGVGTDLCFGLVVSSVGGRGTFPPATTIRPCCGGWCWRLAGVLLGAWLSSVLPARPLRAALSVALFALGSDSAGRPVFDRAVVNGHRATPSVGVYFFGPTCLGGKYENAVFLWLDSHVVARCAVSGCSNQ